MKNYLLTGFAVVAMLSSCSTVQSLVQNTFPYTTNILVASGTAANSDQTALSPATSISQFVGNASNTKDIRVSNASINITAPTGQSMGLFNSVKVYISGTGTSEVLVAQRSGISDNISNALTLDLATSSTLDHIVKSGSVKVKLVYNLKQSPTQDLTLKTALSFSSVPITDK